MTHPHETPAQAKAHAAEAKADAKEAAAEKAALLAEHETEDVEPLPPPPPEPLKVGDVVTLNIGGPPMTIMNISGNGLDVTCWWFGKDDTLHEKIVHTSELTYDKEANEAKAKKKADKEAKEKADAKAKAKKH